MSDAIDLSPADLEFAVLPVPAFPEHTVMIPAGSVTFGVEYRHLDEAMILAMYGPEARAKFDNKRPAGMGAIVEEDGLAIHVFESASGHEALRFDCFDDAPHFHLLHPPTPRNRIWNHPSAEGVPLLEWALATMRRDLRRLIDEAGFADAAAAIDERKVAIALGVVEQVARYVRAAGRPVNVAPL